MTFPAFPTPAGATYPVKRTIVSKTLVQTAISGRVTDQPLWTSPIYRGSIPVSGMLSTSTGKGGLLANEWQVFEDFWKTVKFSAGARFTIAIPDDNTASSMGMGTGDGTTTEFQITRTLSSFPEPVLVPVCGPSTPGTDLDYGNCTSGVGTTIDYGNCTSGVGTDLDYGYTSTMQIFESSSGPVAAVLAPWSFEGGSAQASAGLVDIVPAPSNGVELTWTGAYLWLCRIPDDQLEEENFMYTLYSLKEFAFETVRL